MRRLLGGLIGALLLAYPALAADRLVVSTWGGSFKDLIEATIAKKFKAETGADVVYQTGGTMDRLNKAKLAGDTPESDITFTTSHVGWLYANDHLFEPLDLTKIRNADNLVAEARVSPYHVGVWGYVYTIGYRPDLLPAGVDFSSWEGLWNPKLKDMVSAPDFDPSHLIAVSAALAGTDVTHWQKGEDKLLALRPNFKAFYTNDANSQQLITTGETPVEVILSMNAYHLIGQGVPVKLVMPKEGGVLGIDTIAINKGSKQQALATKFIEAALDPEVQAQVAELDKASPTVTNAKVGAETAALPGVFTTAKQWSTLAINIDPKLRAEKTTEWRKWFAENIMAR